MNHASLLDGVICLPTTEYGYQPIVLKNSGELVTFRLVSDKLARQVQKVQQENKELREQIKSLQEYIIFIRFC
jgi:hypothetical protein